MTVTLADIEREVAPRCGPYQREELNSDTHTSTVFYVDALKSTLTLGGIEDLYVLRRGIKSDGTAVSGFTDADRLRTAVTYIPSAGGVEVDRVYATLPVEGELVEFHHLHPDRQLRASVLAGLKRCYMADRADLTVLTYAAERSLTALAPWVTDPGQVLGLLTAITLVQAPTAPTVAVGAAGVLTGDYTYRVTFVTTTGETQGGITTATVSPAAQRVELTNIPVSASSYVTARKIYRTTAGGSDGTQQLVATLADNTTTTYSDNTADASLGAAVPFINTTTGTGQPIPQWWTGLSVRAGSVWFGAAPDPTPHTVMLLSKRPHWFLVNGGLSLTGPTEDDDTLSVALEYAAAAAHIEAWRIARTRLADAAARGLGISQEDAAAEFTTQAARHYRPPAPSDMQPDYPMAVGGALATRTSFW